MSVSYPVGVLSPTKGVVGGPDHPDARDAARPRSDRGALLTVRAGFSNAANTHNSPWPTCR